MCPLNRRAVLQAGPIRWSNLLLSVPHHHFVPGVLDVGLVEAMTRFPPSPLMSSAIRFSMIDRVKRVHFYSTLFLSKNGIMTERGVGRYPYLHRQTMLFFSFDAIFSHS